jgi:hypothetical protein
VWECVVPIRPFLEGEAFDPEVIEAMSEALADACTTLGLKDKEDAAVRLLAMRMIAQARAGVHDRALLKAAALEGLGPATKH